MLRFNFAVNSVLGALLVTPAVTLGVQHNDSLEGTLKRTIASLEELGCIEQRLQSKDASAIADVLRWTEPALQTSSANPAARDEALHDLRGVVSRLQRDMDELENTTPPDMLATKTHAAQAQLTIESVAEAPEPMTTGLDDALRRRLGERVRPVLAETPRLIDPQGDDLKLSKDAKTAFEGSGYAADALRLGRAYYRQSDFAKALTSFEALPNDHEALYWKARCLEKLHRETEAISAYNALIAMPDGGYSAQRAKEDLEFLEWRLSFESTRAQKAQAETKKP